jgi:hypothetical protein
LPLGPIGPRFDSIVKSALGTCEKKQGALL